MDLPVACLLTDESSVACVTISSATLPREEPCDGMTLATTLCLLTGFVVEWKLGIVLVVSEAEEGEVVDDGGMLSTLNATFGLL